MDKGTWMSATSRHNGRKGLFFIDLHVIGIDVGLGVHTPFAIVLGGENRLFGSSFSAVVVRLAFGVFNLEVLNEKVWVSLRVFAVFDKP